MAESTWCDGEKRIAGIAIRRDVAEALAEGLRGKANVRVYSRQVRAAGLTQEVFVVVATDREAAR